MTEPDIFGTPERLGMVVAGSLTDGVEVRLYGGASIEDVKVGTFVTLQGDRARFFGVVTDVSLRATDQALVSMPPDVSDPYIASVVSGTAAYGVIKVEPMLIQDIEGPMPSKTVPSHFATVSPASEEDIALVFGAEDERNFWIGSPLDMESKLCLNIQSLVERSNGVFGKSGTGKTFLTRLLLIGILQSNSAVNLVFDMHGEYGWEGSSEGNRKVKGLKQLFSSKVAVFSLDEESSKRRGLTPDYVVRIGFDEVEPEDIEILCGILDLSSVAADAAYSLERHYGRRKWLGEFLNLEGRESLFDLADAISVNGNALARLHNRLSRLKRFGFMDEKGHSSVDRILEYLDRGMHVVLEFGRYGSNLAAYILVANLLTRRIYARYMERKERASGDPSSEPRPLVITIEEAHKYLTSDIASHTIFGTIAREMRKYNVTLMLVDQRPGDIDEEVMSQLGTRITCLLDSEKDVTSVLAGAPGGRKLRSVLSRLESKQQALVFGHAVPMPVVIETRTYGTPESYRELGWKDAVELKAQMEQDAADLFGPGEA